jgi:hypothetical protein
MLAKDKATLVLEKATLAEQLAAAISLCANPPMQAAGGKGSRSPQEHAASPPSRPAPGPNTHTNTHAHTHTHTHTHAHTRARAHTAYDTACTSPQPAHAAACTGCDERRAATVAPAGAADAHGRALLQQGPPLQRAALQRNMAPLQHAGCRAPCNMDACGATCKARASAMKRTDAPISCEIIRTPSGPFFRVSINSPMPRGLFKGPAWS